MASVTKLNNLRNDVENSFEEIRKALQMREKLLLRQIDVIESQSIKNHLNEEQLDEIKFIPIDERDLLSDIRQFGRFNINNINFCNDLINEDYICPTVDHETMYKFLHDDDDDNNNGSSGCCGGPPPPEGNDEVDKNLNSINNNNNNGSCIGGDDGDGTDDNNDDVIIDLTNNNTNKKLIKQNVMTLNESIINITLNEAKELIKNAEYFYNKNNLTKSSQTDLTSKIKDEKFSKKKSNITINNCNGTINLKNISNLIINCTNPDSVHSRNTNRTVTTTSTTSTSSSSSSTRPSSITNNSIIPSQNDVTTMLEQHQQHQRPESSSSITKSNEIISEILNDEQQNNDTITNDDNTIINSVNCEFYNRLISEIKNTLKQQTHKITNHHNLKFQSLSTNERKSLVIDDDDGDNATGVEQQQQQQQQQQPMYSSTTTTTTDSTTPNDSFNRKLLLKNFENLKIVLENNENDTHPIQIEQWLTEIISETEIEPIQNIEILEHSQINGNENSNSNNTSMT